jgi:hypothetical protein
VINQRHPQGPSKLNRLDVFPDGLAVDNRQALQPVAQRLTPGVRSKESRSKCGDRFFFPCQIVPNLVRFANVFLVVGTFNVWFDIPHRVSEL